MNPLGPVNPLVPVTLFGWIPLIFVLFAVLPGRRAVLASFLLAWLFLPVYSYKVQGIPAYTKMSATAVGVLLATLVFDSGRLLGFRPRLVDIPMLIWCLCPIASSMKNDLGLYDGLSTSFGNIVSWGLPYLIGRIYFTTLDEARELAAAIFVGGLVYMPLCLLEVRIAPILHYKIYGIYQHSFLQHIRFGGFRPMVFMEHGLMVGLWMAAASLVGVWFWATGVITARRWPAVSILLPMLVLTTVLCKCVNATVLMIVGLSALYLTRWLRTRALLVLLLAVPPTYMMLRVSGVWDASQLVSFTETFIDHERADSLQSRLTQEDLFSRKALQQPAFGWGGWGRMFPRDPYGKMQTRGVDSLWIIALGTYGFVGLISLVTSILLPSARTIARLPVRCWTNPLFAPAGVLALVVVAYMIDSLYNGLFNPIYVLAMGALAALRIEQAPPVSEAANLRQIDPVYRTRVVVRAKPVEFCPPHKRDV